MGVLSDSPRPLGTTHCLAGGACQLSSHHTRFAFSLSLSLRVSASILHALTILSPRTWPRFDHLRSSPIQAPIACASCVSTPPPHHAFCPSYICSPLHISQPSRCSTYSEPILLSRCKAPRNRLWAPIPSTEHTPSQSPAPARVVTSRSISRTQTSEYPPFPCPSPAIETSSKLCDSLFAACGQSLPPASLLTATAYSRAALCSCIAPQSRLSPVCILLRAQPAFPARAAVSRQPPASLPAAIQLPASFSAASQPVGTPAYQTACLPPCVLQYRLALHRRTKYP